MTDVNRLSADPWNRKTRIELGRALLFAHPQPLSAAQLAAATRKDPSNVRKIADGLVTAGVIHSVEPSVERKTGRGGRKPDRLFAFAAGEREKFAAQFTTADGPAIANGSQLVFVDISSLPKELVECLARPSLSRAKWAAVCDGKRQELVVAFEGETAGQAALDLMGALGAAEAEASRAVVSELCSGVELVRRFGLMRDAANAAGPQGRQVRSRHSSAQAQSASRTPT
jgi:hypothetical protein